MTGAWTWIFLANFVSTDAPVVNPLPVVGVELKTGPYRPAISANPQQRRTYELLFESRDNSLFTHAPLMTGLEVDWYFFDRFGLLGATFSAAFWGQSGKARNCVNTPDGVCTPDNIESSVAGSTDVAMKVLPLSVGLVYRLDVLKRRFDVPLAAYVKGGFDYWFWWTTAAGRMATHGDKKAFGTAYGLHAAGGVALNLDFIEPSSAQRAIDASGITDTYLFFEARPMWAASFGDSSRLDLSDVWMMVGINVDFNR